MRLELNRVAPVRAANVVGAIHFVLFAAIALVMVPFTWILPPPPHVDPMRWMLLAYPVFGGLSGWLVAFAGAATYNAVAPRVGGLVFVATLDPIDR
jgi:hypothetical protein